MAQKKGQTGNPNGRPKGSPNKATRDLRQFVTNLLTQNQHLIVADLKELKPFERIQAFEKLLKYALPTLQATSLTTDLEKLSDEDLDRIVNEILNKQQ
jgi:hypothetical protein